MIHKAENICYLVFFSENDCQLVHLNVFMLGGQGKGRGFAKFTFPGSSPEILFVKICVEDQEPSFLISILGDTVTEGSRSSVNST